MYVGTARIGIRNHSAATKTNVKLNRTVSSMFYHMCIIVNANAFLLLIVLCYVVVSRRERYIIRVDPHTGFLNMGLRMCFFWLAAFVVDGADRYSMWYTSRLFTYINAQTKRQLELYLCVAACFLNWSILNTLAYMYMHRVVT